MNILRTFLFIIFCSFITAFGMIDITYSPIKNSEETFNVDEIPEEILIPETNPEEIIPEEGILIDLPPQRPKSDFDFLEEIFPPDNNPDLESSESYRDLLEVSFDEDEIEKIKRKNRMDELKKIIEEKQAEDRFGEF